MTTPLLKIFVIFFLIILCNTAHAQQTNQEILWRIETSDGNEYVGTIFKRDPDEIVLSTENLGLITIQMKDVQAMEVVTEQQIKKGEVWTDNPQAARYFWMPNGYGLKRGEGYYQNTLVFVNQASVGLTDNFSIGVGMVPLFLFNGPTPVWITPKFSVPVVKDKVNLGLGALVGTVLGEEETSFGIAYGVSTFGSPDRNLSIGLGYGFSDGGWADTPTISFSGMIRAGKRTYLITENYLIDDGVSNFGLISLGGRTVWSKISLDYGGVIPVNIDGETFVFPWVGIALPFGR